MESDIVTRLRGAAAKDYGCTCVKCEAAAEIERLRAELEEMKKQLAEARGLYLQRNYHREQLERELAAAKAELAAAIKQRDEAKADFVDAWRERSEFAKRIDEADAALADVLQALQKSHDAMVLAKTSHGCFLACDPPLDAWKYRCVDAHLGDAIRECAAAMRKGEA